MSEKYKYSRTPHFSYSKGLLNDDRMLESEEFFKDKTVEVSVKLDGENSNIYNDGYHARSLSSGYHVSRTWIKGYIPTFQKEIPDGWRFVFESMFAKHSIFYDNLETYAYLINIWDENRNCLSLKDTEEWIAKLKLVKVPSICIIKY
ncbi:MAG: RNA ligase family protein, partial [Ignavibacteria bacterium]|nr:RNA ligase family protein [Ignavibacteria bacterium]